MLPLGSLVEMHARVTELDGETVLDVAGPDAVRLLDAIREGAP